MYQRAPKLEEAVAEFSRVFDAAAQETLDRLLPGMRTGLLSDIASRRERMLDSARDIGSQLARAHWWVVRAWAEEAFVLGDSPVVTTISLGYDDAWRAIFSDSTYVVIMPLGPSVALLTAPQRLVPVTGIEDVSQASGAINRLSWRSAGRFVVARDRVTLEAVLSEAEPTARRAVIPVDYDLARISRAAEVAVDQAVTTVWVRYVLRRWLEEEPHRWRRWEGCRLTFGDIAVVATIPHGLSAYEL
jgi:hypothetical protein